MTAITSESASSALGDERTGLFTRLINWGSLYRFEIALGAIAVMPIFIAAIRAISSGYTPINDNGLLLLRSRDVFTSNHPLLGTLSSSTLVFGVQVSNPGPLLFDAMAIPVKLFGSGPGLVVAVTTLNISSIIGAAVVAYRVRGRSAYLSFLLISSILAWGMGSELLFDVWQPHSLIFPFLAFLVLAWAIACGRFLALPWAVAVGSYLIQTHLSYVYLVPSIIVAGFVIGFLATLRDRRGFRSDAFRSDAFRSDALRSDALRGGIFWSGGVLALAWIQPIWQQFLGPGPGNLTRLFNAATGHYGTATGYGSELATLVSAAVFTIAPWNQRPAFADRLLVHPLPQLANARLVIAILLLLFVALIAISWAADYVAERAAAMLSLGLVALAVFSLSLQPTSGFGYLAPHQIRWLWPVGSFFLFTLLLYVSAAPASKRVAVAIFTAFVVVISVLNIPDHHYEKVMRGSRESTTVVARMIKKIDSLRGHGTLRLGFNPDSFGEPFTSPLLAALAEHGIDFVVSDPLVGGQVGERRRIEHCRPKCPRGALLSVAHGAAAYRVPKGAERVIFIAGLTREQRQVLAGLEERLLENGATRDFLGMLIPKDPADSDAAKRFAKLKRALDYGSVAVLLRPAP